LQDESKGLVYFKDGHTEPIVTYTNDEATSVLTFNTKSAMYIRIFHKRQFYQYYKYRVNKNWETDYILINNIDRVELK
jgi:hypothetical protein